MKREIKEFRIGDRVVILSTFFGIDVGSVTFVESPSSLHVRTLKYGVCHYHASEIRHFIKPRIVIDFVEGKPEYRLAVFTTYAKVNLVNAEGELFKKAQRWCAHMNDIKRPFVPSVKDFNQKYRLNNILPFELLG